MYDTQPMTGLSHTHTHTHTQAGRLTYKETNRSECFNTSLTVLMTRLKLIRGLEDVSQSLKHRNMLYECVCVAVANLITEIHCHLLVL